MACSEGSGESYRCPYGLALTLHNALVFNDVKWARVTQLKVFCCCSKVLKISYSPSLSAADALGAENAGVVCEATHFDSVSVTAHCDAHVAMGTD